MARYIQIPFFASLVLLLLALPLIAAWRPTDRTCGGTAICLTSFKWCESAGARECYYPPNVYPQSDTAGQFPALVWEDEYELSWKGVRQDSGTVKVQWVFLNGGGDKETVVWDNELAALNNNIMFKPSASMFLPSTSPVPLSNITFEAAQGLVLQQSLIRIQQGAATANLQDSSDTFTVLPSVTRQIVDQVRQYEKKRWKKKMTVGLVVGILGVSAVAVVGTWFWMRWWTARMRSVRLPPRKIVD